MTRKDTIIAASLINAGLLVVLFVSALNNEEKTGYSSPSTTEFSAVSEDKKNPGIDEVEEVLKRYTQKEAASHTIFEQEPVVILPHVETKEPALNMPAETVTVTAPESRTEIEPYIEIQVKKGDVLEKIAKHHHTTVSEIMKLNQLSSTRLKVGQTLKIAKKVAKDPVASVAKPPLDPTSAKYYTIKSGDNLWTIAVRNHSRVEDLLKLNNMTEEKAKKLKPGDTIRIR